MSDRSSRIVWTSCLVFSSVGLVAGVALNTAVSPAELKRAGETETTPSVAAISFETVATALFASSAFFASTTMVRGPLKPGPKPWARSS
jgi:hypothetical protein